MPIKVGKVNTEAAAQEQKELERGDRKYWTPAEGENKIRIMPPPEGYDTYFAKAGFHYQIGPDNKFFACPKIGGARRSCFLCEEADRLMRSKDEDDIALGKELRATRKFLITIVDLAKPESGFQVWSPGVKAFQEINYYFADPEWGGDVADLEAGFDFVITRKGTGMTTNYGVHMARKPSNFLAWWEKRWDDYNEDVFEKLPHLDEFIEYATDADMENEYQGVGSSTSTRSAKKGRDVEDEDDEEDTRTSSRRRDRGSPAFDDEEETPTKGSKSSKRIDDDDEDEVEEPVRQPRNSRSRREEPEDEDDETEDEPKEERRSSGRSSGRTGSRLRRGLD